MKSNFLNQNRRLLVLCSNVARFCGLLALLGSGVLIAIPVVGVISGAMDPKKAMETLTELLSKIPAIAFYGFLALIIAEFISYLLTSEEEAKWILKHGDKIIYVYVLYYTIVSVFIGLQPGSAKELSVIGFRRILDLSFFGTAIVMRVLIWVGIAITLRKIVPIIKESKTLV